LHHGRDAKIVVKSDSTADALLGLANTTATGTSPSCVTGVGSSYTCGIVTGSTNSSSEVCFTVSAESPGIDGNNTELVIENHVSDGEFTIEVYHYDNHVESWGNLTKTTTSRFYVESYIATVSDYIRITDNTDTAALPSPRTASNPYALSGGTDGIPADPTDQDTLLLGSSTAMTGLQALSDPEQVDIDVVAIPGHASTDIVSGLLTFAGNTRGDCFAILDTPFGLSVREVVQWQNGVHPLNDTRFDSDFGALYWPWLKIRDTFNKIDVWVPPSGSIMAAYARSDQIGGPWLAPAGTTRGLVPNVLDVFSRPSLDERDDMYGNRNAVNPVIQFADIDGFHIWGQKTLQRKPTALDRVNVRRMLLYVEKRIKADSRILLFEPNDGQTQERFVFLAERVLKTVSDQRGISDYIIKCDEELNTPDVIDRNELRARIGIQPTRAAEFVFIEFSIHRTGSFAEGADTF
jgi:phage tail sheath protein FI